MERVTSVDGATVTFVRQGSGEPVLFVHGTIGSAASWALVMPHLASRYTVVAIDRRGRGASTDGAAEYSAGLDADDVAAIVDALGEGVHLVGHSFGAVVALLAAARSPGVRSLVLYEPMLAPQHLPIALGDIIDRVEELVRAGNPAAAVDHWLSKLSVIEIFRPEEVEGFKGNPEVRERFIAAVPTVPREVRARVPAQVLRKAVGRIRVPVLMLTDEKTTAPFFLEGLDELKRALPDARRATIPDQQHMAITFAPKLFAELVESFLVSID